MAVFRIEKTQNYTIMSNHHLRNTALSLKAKGLLSQILSLPENWNYTLAGLSSINRESIDAIRSAIHELEQAGYITRTRERKPNGRLGGTEYIIREMPPEGFTPDGFTTGQDNTPTPPPTQLTPPTPPTSTQPTQPKPISENPTQAISALENKTQLNKDIAIKDKPSTDISNTDSIPTPSHTQPQTQLCHAKGVNPERNGADPAGMSAFEIYREIIQDNIEYPHLLDNYPHDHDRIAEIVDLILETICTARNTIRIASDDYPAELVKAKFLKLNSTHIEFVLDCLQKNTTEIRNIKKYLLAVLFNAPSTIGNYYTSKVAHDMASGKLQRGGN